MQVTHQILDAGWRVREIPREGASPTTELHWLPAQVPGQIHLDLERAGVISDPFYRMHERDVAWVDESDWVYETQFQVAEPPAHAYLRFNGLDTVAEIELNDELLGKTGNMFIPHEFSVGGKLRSGENTLRVTFRSALRVGRERQKAWDDAGNDTTQFHWFNWGPRSFVRKAQYMYGWDWGPELVSCGIWQPVDLITVPVARILDWKYDVEFQGDKAVVTVEATIERAPGQENTPFSFAPGLTTPQTYFDRDNHVSATVDVPTGKGSLTVKASLVVEKPIRWWPNGHSNRDESSSLYDLHMALVSPQQPRIDYEDARIGLRAVELLQEDDPDGKGRGFKFRVNGEDVFMKGANWIPADSFPARLEYSEYSNRLENVVRAAADAGYNMLRVWGGGLYESEHFYDLCDELGIMVWQDFPYACAYYPDTGEYADEARREAAAAVRRISKHPSIALWCGNNENMTMFESNWSGHLPPRYLGEHLYNEVLPTVVKEESPKTSYIASSPQGGKDANSQDFGDRHNWDVWHGVGDWIHYSKDRARFCSEFGFAASCSMAAWDRSLAPSDKWPMSPAVRWHDKTRKGYETYLGLVKIHHPAPQTLEDLVYYTQINQAEALKYGIEHYRRIKGRCWGTLFWQINDCWPVQSWAVIDYLAVPKAAYYASQRFYAPVLLSLFKPDSGNVAEVHLVSDLMASVQGTATVSIESFDGEILAKTELRGSVGPNGAGLIGKIDLSVSKGKERESYVNAVFQGRAGDQEIAARNDLFLAEQKDLRIADPGISLTLREGGGSPVIDLQAARFAPYVWLEIDQASGTDLIQLSDNFFHLHPNEKIEVQLKSASGICFADVQGRIKIRTL